jgi:predicted enzyme related to lactoylglutathione lyase
MGAMGTYQTFAAAGATIGGMMTKPADAPAHWGYYINVEAIDAAIARVERAGGTLIAGPHEVPTGEWMMNGRDPRGAMFGLLAPRR